MEIEGRNETKSSAIDHLYRRFFYSNHKKLKHSLKHLSWLFAFFFYPKSKSHDQIKENILNITFEEPKALLKANAD